MAGQVRPYRVPVVFRTMHVMGLWRAFVRQSPGDNDIHLALASISTAGCPHPPASSDPRLLVVCSRGWR